MIEGQILEEYCLDGTQTRFIDTMALHIAVKGISSHQRPAWMKHRKNKEKAAQRHEETVAAISSVVEQLRDAEALLGDSGVDLEKREVLHKMRVEMEESLPQLHADALLVPDLDPEPAKRWEGLTSVNSHDKEPRDDFLTSTPSEICASIHSHLD